MATLRKHHQSKAAYTLVDISELDDDLRKDIILDANEGGGIYGIRVVEEAINGGARAPIYGVYNDGPDADRWAEAKDKLGISGEEVDDSTVYAGAGGIEVTDPAREAAMREAAAQQAEREADRLRAGEDREVAAVTGDLDHPVNIVDPAAVNAENEVSKLSAQSVDDTSASNGKKSTNKTPK